MFNILTIELMITLFLHKFQEPLKKYNAFVLRTVYQYYVPDSDVKPHKSILPSLKSKDPSS